MEEIKVVVKEEKKIIGLKNDEHSDSNSVSDNPLNTMSNDGDDNVTGSQKNDLNNNSNHNPLQKSKFSFSSFSSTATSTKNTTTSEDCVEKKITCPAEYSGYLFKKSPRVMVGWQKRFFKIVEKTGDLLYYTSVSLFFLFIFFYLFILIIIYYILFVYLFYFMFL
jgi:hypothetical protein